MKGRWRTWRQRERIEWKRREENWISSTCSELISAIKKLFPSLTVEHQPEGKCVPRAIWQSGLRNSIYSPRTFYPIVLKLKGVFFYAEQWKKNGAFRDTPTARLQTGSGERSQWTAGVQTSRVQTANTAYAEAQCTDFQKSLKFSGMWGCNLGRAVRNILTRDRPCVGCSRARSCGPFVHTTQVIQTAANVQQNRLIAVQCCYAAIRTVLVNCNAEF